MTTIPTLPASLTPALTGRDAIADALYRCVIGFDTGDTALFDSAFLLDSTFEINGRVLSGLPEIHTGCFDPISKLDTTHFISNIRINIEDNGTEASLTASSIAQHYRAGKGMEADQPRLLGGSLYYVDLVKREEDGGLWRIKAIKINSTWVEGDWGIIKGE
ncbi:nuclear transport factor 2 family protein [Aspergillus melleus]|uniref:nuclear transport factor 2 family protein n=1 Tax=Aspergillus melleus TaxID=138277 RepID=UPI001E8E9250|nr:uncharacterized protein LDX57_010423 [Aspergillus melleus]KAH8432796.1 hypothetical protein LDX57_010423 [Aspergillus melleus]